jgi:cell wall-associated NlpC family hydrolase
MDQYGFCALSIIPVRAEASDRTEMVNQLLFGETFEVVDKYNGWKVIRGSLDSYEGFIDEKQCLCISAEEYARLQTAGRIFPKELVARITETSVKSYFNILYGSSLPGYANGAIRVGDKEFRYDGEFTHPGTAIIRAELVHTAKKFLGSPYLWGGRSPFGIDCSGLMQVVFNIHGFALHRDASYQAQQGTTLNLVSEALPGDLAFFDNEEEQIVHVGMFIEDEKIIHASGQVRIDKIDHQGIFNEQLGKYTHRLRLVKRVVGM